MRINAKCYQRACFFCIKIKQMPVIPRNLFDVVCLNKIHIHIKIPTNTWKEVNIHIDILCPSHSIVEIDINETIETNYWLIRLHRLPWDWQSTVCPKNAVPQKSNQRERQHIVKKATVHRPVDVVARLSHMDANKCIYEFVSCLKKVYALQIKANDGRFFFLFAYSLAF